MSIATARIAPNIAYLLREAQPAVKIARLLMPVTPTMNRTPTLRLPRKLSDPSGNHREYEKHGDEEHYRGDRERWLVGRVRDDVLFRKQLEHVGERLEQPEGAPTCSARASPESARASAARTRCRGRWSSLSR